MEKPSYTIMQNETYTVRECNLRVGYVFKPKFMKEIALDVTINNLFNEQYETNAWVYSAMVDGERYKEDGYFTQAGTNAMARVTFKF